MTVHSAEKLARDCRAAAKDAGSLILAAPLDTRSSGLPHAPLNAEQMMAVISTARVTIIYLWEEKLDPEAAIEDVLEQMGATRDDAIGREVLRATRRLEKHRGESARTSVELVSGGVLHSAYAAADWMEQFDDAIEPLVERAREEAKSRMEAGRTAMHERHRDLARQLIEDPAFDFRPSAAKRRFLASELFPGESRTALDAIAELAESMRWLASARE